MKFNYFLFTTVLALVFTETKALLVVPASQRLPTRIRIPVALKVASIGMPPQDHKIAKDYHHEGILSPIVLLAKEVLGDEELNKIRGKVISLHSDVIGKFVNTVETPFGSEVLKMLFNIADHKHNGLIDEEELSEALGALGFDWLKEKHIHGILERADVGHDGFIDLDEWMAEAPKTLRTNLIKLAKKNGGELGLLV